MTITELHQKKLAAIKSSYASVRKVKSVDEGDVVLVGSIYKRSTLHLAEVTKIDSKGVIHTSVGVRFSTTKDFFSTTKIDDDWWLLFDLERTYEDYLKRKEEEDVYNLLKSKDSTQELISKLNPVADKDFIDQIRLLTSEYTAGKQLKNPHPICVAASIRDLIPLCEGLQSCEIKYTVSTVVEGKSFNVHVEAEYAETVSGLCSKILKRWDGINYI